MNRFPLFVKLERWLFGLFLMLSLIYLASCATVPHKKSLRHPSAQGDKIALFVPLDGPYASQGQAVRNGFLAAYYDAGSPKNINIHVYDTSKNTLQALYTQAVNEGSRVIIGPLDKPAVQQVSQLPLSIPVIALNYIPMTQKHSPKFLQFGLSPQNEAALAARHAWQQGKRRIVMIYPNTDWGKGIARAFIDNWQPKGGAIANVLPYDGQTNFSQSLLLLLRSKATQTGSYFPQLNFDSVFLVAQPETARVIVPQLRHAGLSNQPIYALSTLYSGNPNLDANRDLDNVYFCDIPFVIDSSGPNATLRAQLLQTFGGTFQNNIRLYALGFDAYALAMRESELFSHQGFIFNGYTGRLSLNQSAITRDLPWAQFKQGAVQPSN